MPTSENEMGDYNTYPSSNTIPVPTQMSKIPEALPDSVKCIIAGSQYMMQEINHKLRSPMDWQHQQTAQVRIDQQPQSEESSTSDRLAEAFAPLQPRIIFSQDMLEDSPALEEPAANRNYNNDIAAAIPLIPGSIKHNSPYGATGHEHIRIQTSPNSGDQLLYSMAPSNPNQPRVIILPTNFPSQPVRPVPIGKSDTQNPAYHYATVKRDSAFFQHPSQLRNPTVQPNMSLIALNSLRDLNTNKVRPNVLLGHPSNIVHQTHESLQRRFYNSRATDDIDTTAPFSFQSRALASPFRSPQQSVLSMTFHHTRLLTDIRTKAQQVHYIRRSRIKHRLNAAVACTYEVHWREQSRGRYILDDDDNLTGAYQESSSDGTVLRTLRKLGFRREGVFNNFSGRFELPEERQEDQKWRTIEEWRALLRSGGTDLDERERWELGLNEMSAGMREDEVRAALESEENWNFDVRAALRDVPLETVVLDNEGNFEGLITEQRCD